MTMRFPKTATATTTPYARDQSAMRQDGCTNWLVRLARNCEGAAEAAASPSVEEEAERLPAWTSSCSHSGSASPAAAPASSAALGFPASAPAVPPSVQFAATGSETIAMGRQPGSPDSPAVRPGRLPRSSSLLPGSFAAEWTSAPPESEVERYPQPLLVKVCFEPAGDGEKGGTFSEESANLAGRKDETVGKRDAKSCRPRRTPGSPLREFPGTGWSAEHRGLLRAL